MTDNKNTYFNYFIRI